jgi:hypothetical protein
MRQIKLTHHHTRGQKAAGSSFRQAVSSAVDVRSLSKASILLIGFVSVMVIRFYNLAIFPSSDDVYFGHFIQQLASERTDTVLDKTPIAISDNNVHVIEDFDSIDKNARKQKNSTKIDNITVFYNLFVNPNADHSETMRVQDIVKEQMSYLIPDIHYPVYVHSIGKELPIPNTELLAHHATGGESVTLHSMWQYCQKHKGKKVVYMHSKGSFHSHERNELLRRFLTRSALSRQCAHKDEIGSLSCNVCSGRFSPFPHPHCSGNMFLADCDYVAKLINPLDFENRMNDIPRVKEFLALPPEKQMDSSFMGIGRYSYEHWIHSAPFVKPCDLYKPSTFVWGYDGVPNASEVDTIDLHGEDSEFELQPAPRFPFWVYELIYKGLRHWTGFEHRFEEYQSLYNETPPGPSIGSPPSTATWWGWRMEEWVNEAIFKSPAGNAR